MGGVIYWLSPYFIGFFRRFLLCPPTDVLRYQIIGLTSAGSGRYRAPLRFALRMLGTLFLCGKSFYVTSLLEGGLLVRGESRPHVLAHESFFWSGRNQLFLEKAFFVGMMRHTASIRMPGGANLPILARGIWN